ncbi:MULE domain-containing protein [Trichonephila inaurata madagascariensis]|uniref:MULE domain-containing protein n=1 Tax=Trichonephila inaurata madagascariensis TaxID=2747483 RepID=A0A8X7C606_9ARAC|nr:MULE domain-containing protein [Trichonephila inaurata madagascariensis]
MSKYVRQRGCKTLKNGDIVINYHCCRSGTYKPKGKSLNNLKSQGSAKIGISCPAVIKVRQSTENVVVQYFPKHQNHEIQLEHLRLSESDRTAIAGRLKEGISEKIFLQDIREEITVDSGRKMLIEKKDIHNIKRYFNVQFSQKEMITKYGKDKICTDGTHGISSYDFNLYSILVDDEHKNGIPEAFCFSNRSSEDVFKIYFSAIKNTVGKIETTTFMTDDAPAFYNAWSYVMGTVKNVLLCAWHVTRNWHQNLNKINSPEKRKIVNKAVKDELCLETFSNLMKQFIEDL